MAQERFRLFVIRIQTINNLVFIMVVKFVNMLRLGHTHTHRPSTLTLTHSPCNYKSLCENGWADNHHSAISDMY